MAMKRNLGHGAAATIVRCLEAPVGEKLIYRWELALAANIVCQARSFYSMHAHFMSDVFSLCRVSAGGSSGSSAVGPLLGISWEIHTLRGDATNSAAIHSCKAHVLE
eukprot:15440574-Alexandrium_andersonii.AAC.1